MEKYELQASKWVPVELSRPKEGQLCFIYHHLKYVDVVRFAAGAFWASDQRRREDNVSGIQYWQPAPEGYGPADLDDYCGQYSKPSLRLKEG